MSQASRGKGWWAVVIGCTAGLALSCSSSGDSSKAGQPGRDAGAPDGPDTGLLPGPDAGALADPDAGAAPGKPVGWSEESHGKKAAPDYDKVFPANAVGRFDLVIPADQWAAMLADMTDMLGEPGAGTVVPDTDGGVPGGGFPGGTPPAELTQPCVGKQAGDACTVTMMGHTAASTCSSLGGVLVCIPAGIGPGGPGMPDGGLPGGSGTPDGGTTDGGTAGGPGFPGGGGGLEMLPREPMWAHCTLRFDGREWPWVGVRFKGNSTLAMSWMAGNLKLPLRISFDKFEDDHPETKDQRFYGVKTLALASGINDPSYLRERVADEVFRSAGVATPRAAFYRLFIDHGTGPTYFGLYTFVEVPAKPMLDTLFGDSSGNLYKPDGAGATFATFDEGSFPKNTNEKAANFSDVKALFDALHADRTDATAWRRGLEATFDVQAFLRWLAVNTVIADWDTYGQMSHNYYLYGDPKHAGRLVWIPWDHGESLKSTDSGGGAAIGTGQSFSLALDEVGDGWPLIRFLLDDPTYRTSYRGFVQATAQGAFAPASTNAMLDRYHQLIEPFVTGAERETADLTLLGSPGEFDAALTALHEHVAARAAAVQSYLAGDR